MKIQSKLLSISIASIGVIASATQSSAAIVTLFAEDTAPPAPTTLPNSVGAFQNALDAIAPDVPAIEDFEGFNLADGAPITDPLSFTTAGGTTVEATLTGNVVYRNETFNGLYSTTNQRLAGLGEPTLPEAPGYLNVFVDGSSTFNVKFDQPVGNFGFFGTDIGDFGGTLSVRLLNDGVEVGVFEIPTTPGSGGSTNEYAIFQGFSAETAADVFDEIDFFSTEGLVTENFGFDDFTISLFEEPPQPPTGTPEPSALIGLGLLGGMGFLSRRRKAK